MAYTKDRYTSDDYFEYVMSLKYSEAIEMLTCIGKEHKLNINTASGFIKGMTIYAGVVQRMNQQLIDAGMTFKIKQMSAFLVLTPFIGMGATSSNVNGNLRPHTIVAVNENEITTTLDFIDEDDNFKTNRDGNNIEWILKDNANPSNSLYIPKDPIIDRYTDLVINKKQFYTNNNL